MAGRPVTMRDVADRAGVSTATVSRVLNGRADVAAGLRERVRDAMSELGYHPNGPARGLRTRTSSLLGLIIPDITNPFFTAIARGLEDVAQDAGYSLVIANADEDVDKERRYLEVAAAEQMAGVVLSAGSTRESRLDGLGGLNGLDGLGDRGMPVVVVDQRLRHEAVDSVRVNNRASAQAATAALLDLGCRRVGMVAGPASTSTGADRLAGYRAAMRASGRSTGEVDGLVVREEYRIEGGYAGTLALAQRVPDLDGLLVANNVMTLGALDALEELGIEVPEQLAVVGFDDLPWASGAYRRISVVRQPAYEIGRTAGELLLQRIRGPRSDPRHLVLAAELVHGSRARLRPRPPY